MTNNITPMPPGVDKNYLIRTYIDAVNRISETTGIPISTESKLTGLASLLGQIHTGELWTPMED